MSSVWRKTLVYLGLVEETEAEDVPQRFGQRPAPDVQPRPAEVDATNVRPLRVPEPGAAHVRPSERTVGGRVSVVEVANFDDAAQIGAEYRAGRPVLFDLAGLDTTEARRILDFVSGVTYALRGRLQKAGQKAFLLTPEHLELGSEDLGRLSALGYEVRG